MQPFISRNNRAIQSRSRAGVLVAPDVRMVNIMLLVAVVISFVSYLVLNNGVSTKGFEIRALKTKISTLEDERQKIDLAAVAGQSMETVDGRIQGLGFVPVATLEFVNGTGGEVAMR